MKEIICIHFILNDKLFLKQYISHAPITGDEIRIGGEGNEKYYLVGRRIWVYDEPENPHARLNIEVTKLKNN